MTVAVLDINDCNLRLWHGERQLQSPGYALLEGKDYRFGQDARGAARLQPRKINTRYWWQLSTEALQPALGPARHTADLVHAHLLELHRQAGEPGELLLAASSGMQREQLSLLLGIAQQCPFDIAGLVNRSTLLGSLHGGQGRIFHIEIQLHQALLCELHNDGRNVSVQRSVPLPGCGMLQMQERLVEVLASGFVRQTRFDPRRKATTEQDLYNALPDALKTLASASEANIEINGYRARISRDDLSNCSDRLYDSATQAMGTLAPEDRVIAESLAGLLPGFAQRVDSLQLSGADALVEAVREHGDALISRGQALGFVSALPALRQACETPIEPTVLAPPPPLPSPTHCLSGSQARPLDPTGTRLEAELEIYRSDQGWQLRGQATSVNNEPWDASRLLVAGDCITTASGTQLTLIEVLPAGG